MNNQEQPFPKDVAAPARRALAGIGVTEVRQCANFSESDLMELHGMGPKALNAIRASLETMGLTFRNASSRHSSSG